ncbi:PIN domain-containing protein [Candidatus Parcubacteria bacterium]|nr:MAG: PIN domain-containing protein [Candidatus Parcubacteria bacterium]
MKVLFDTNVLLDLLLERSPFVAPAARLVARVERGELVGLLGATTVTTIHYLVAKVAGKDKAIEGVRNLLTIFAVAPVNRTVLELAESSGFSDFEDAVLHEAGRLAGANAIVTRNPDDFKTGTLIVHTPAALEAILSLSKSS